MQLWALTGKKTSKQIQFIIDKRMIFSKELKHGVFVNEILK